MIRRSYIYTFVLCLLLCSGFSTTLASTAVVPRDEEMVIESRAIVTGKVIEIATGLDASKGLVFTYVRLRIEMVLKGQISESEIVLKELGGEAGDFGTMIFGMPKFEVGQDVFLYLNTWPDGSLRVHQGFLGKFNVTSNSSSGRLEVARQEEGSGAQIMTSSAKGTTTDSGDLDTYIARINALVGATTDTAEKFEQKYYPGVAVLAVPAGFDRDREFGKIKPNWVSINPVRPLRWFEPDSGRQIVFVVNPAGAPQWDYQDDIRQALNAWSTAGASFKAILGGTTAGCGVQTSDGANTISFNNCDGFFAPSSSCSGMLAVGGITRYSTSDTKTVNGMTFNRGIEANVSINPYALCNFSNRCQFQEMLTHELGHALGLGHSSDISATMSAYAHFDGRCASLTADDTTGVKSIYPGASNTGSLSIVTGSDLPSVKVERDYAIALEARGGAGGYRWTRQSGELPSGLLFSASGFLYGKPTASGTFTVSLQVKDSSGFATQKNFTLIVQAPNPTPVIVGVEFKKKLTVFGNYFDSAAQVVVDGKVMAASLNGSALKTKKKAKLSTGVHVVYVVNEDGKRSNDFTLVVG
jgi:hypothetical protein